LQNNKSPRNNNNKRKEKTMAALSKNGAEVRRFELLRKTYSIRSNGKILWNAGHGWKVAKLKPGVTVEKFVENREADEAKIRENRPCFAAYRRAVQAEFPLSVRWQYLAAESILGDDIDGIWSELNDGFPPVHVDIETLAELNRLRAASRMEYRALQSEETTV
jgi:hypothetical protein